MHACFTEVSAFFPARGAPALVLGLFAPALVTLGLAAQPLTIRTLAGSPGMPGAIDETSSDARFSLPVAVATDAFGNLYVADTYNHTIRKVSSPDPDGDPARQRAVTTLAGSAALPGSVNGTGSAARFHDPSGVATDAAGNLYVADTYNHTIRMVTPGGEVTTLAGLAGAPGDADGKGSVARLYYPSGVAMNAGNVYIADTHNHTIRVGAPDPDGDPARPLP